MNSCNQYYEVLFDLEDLLNALNEKNMPNIDEIDVRLIWRISQLSSQTDEYKIADAFYEKRNLHINTLRLVHSCNPDWSKGRSDIQMEVTSPKFFSGDKGIEKGGTPNKLTEIIMDTIAWNYESCPRPQTLLATQSTSDGDETQQGLTDQDIFDNIVYINNLLYVAASEATIQEFIQNIEAPQNKFQTIAANVMEYFLEKSPYAQKEYSYESALKTVRKGLDLPTIAGRCDSKEDNREQVKMLSDIIDSLFWNEDIPQKSEHMIKGTLNGHHWCEPCIEKALQDQSIESISVRLNTAKTNLLEQVKIYEPQRVELAQEIEEIMDCIALLCSDVQWYGIENAANNIQCSLREYVNTIYEHLLSEDESEAIRQSVEDYIFRVNDDIYTARLLTTCIFLFCVYYAQQFSFVKEEQSNSKTVDEQTTAFSFMKQNKSLFVPLWGRDAQKGSNRAKACEKLYCDIYNALTQASVSNLIRRGTDRVQEFIPVLPLLRNSKCNLFEFSPMVSPELIAYELCVDLDLPEESVSNIVQDGRYYIHLMTAFRNQQETKEKFYRELEQKPYKKVFDAVFTVSDPKHLFPFLFRGNPASKKFEECVDFLFSLIQHYYQEEANQLSLEQKYMCIYKKLHLKLVDCNPSLYWAVTQYIPDKDTPDALKDDFDKLLSKIIFEEFHNQIIEFRKVLEKNLNRLGHQKIKRKFFRPKVGDVKRWDLSLTKKFFEKDTTLTTPNDFYRFLKHEWGIKIRREDFNSTEYALQIFDQCQKLCEDTINKSIYLAIHRYFSKYFPLRANTDNKPSFENY